MFLSLAYLNVQDIKPFKSDEKWKRTPFAELYIS